jgi:hypothetical protein
LADPPNSDPVPETISFQDHIYAKHNHGIRPKSYKPIRTSYTSRLGEIRNAINDRVRNNETEGVIEFLARVLRVENKNNDNEDETGVFDWVSSFFGGEEKAPVIITAIIDADVHALAWGRSGVGHPDFVLPNDAGQGGSANATNIINKIRDAHKGKFIAPDNGVPTPKVGEMVWVTWQDLENRRDGVYLRPLIARDNNSGVDENSGGDQNKKTTNKPCNKLKSKKPSGRQNRNRNADANSMAGNVRQESIDAKKERGQPPVGKGVFTGFPDIKTHKINQALHCTLNWVCYTGAKQSKDGEIESANISKIKKFVKKYHKKGIRTYIMGYPAYGHEEKFLAKLFSLANSGDAIGVILNLDHYYSGQAPVSPYEKENTLMSEFKKYADKKNFATGLTATDIAGNPNIPWKIFADSKTGVDFAIPQVFSQDYSSLRDEEVDNTPPPPPVDPEVGQPTSFDGLLPGNYRELTEIFKLPAGLLEKWDASTGFNTKGDEDSDFNIRSIYMKAAAEVIEQYWKQILPGQNAKVFITSHRRDKGKGNHSTGGAFDVRIELGDSPIGKAGLYDRVPVLQTWASLKKLQGAGRLPMGGTGLYLNVKKNNPRKGIVGLKPTQAGAQTEGSGQKGGPGGSASPHYDMRGYLYAGTSHTRNTIWVNLDKTGNGKDDVKNTDSARYYLRQNNLDDVADYVYRDDGTWANDGDYEDGYLPAVGPQVQNLLQVLGLDSQAPVLKTSGAEGPFVAKFMAWKQVGFKYIIPGLGMIGNSPNPNGWSPDAYNTNEKSPWRLRQDATWTFTSVKKALGNSMANSVIWWDWEGANKTAVNWPEKRWAVIRELGNAIATAQKLNKIKKSSISQGEKDKITNWQLGNYMKASDSPGEAKAKQQKKEDPPPDPPADKAPSETPPEDTPTPTGLTEEKRQEIQNKIDNKVKNLKARETELAQLKTQFTSAENAGEDTTNLLNAVKAKTAEVNQELAQINNLRAQLGQEAIAGSSGDPKDPCAHLTLGKPTKIDPELSNVEFLDYGLKKGKPLKSRSYIVIHEPGGGTSVKGVLRYLKKEGNSVHFTVSMKGAVKQHVSMQLAAFHAGSSANYNSIGIEVMNPSPEGAPGKKYIPGSRQQLERLWKLVVKISIAGTPGIPKYFVAAAGDIEAYNWRDKLPLRPGIHAHRMQGNTNHSDGAFPVLYMSLRNRGLGPGAAYKKAWEMFSTKSGVSIPENPAEKEDNKLPEGGAQQVCPDGQEPIGTDPETGGPLCP